MPRPTPDPQAPGWRGRYRDIDLFVRPSPDDAVRVVQALVDFGAPIAAHNIGTHEFTVPGTVYEIGLPPRRTDLLTEISGVPLAEAWKLRLEANAGAMQWAFPGKEALKKNKLAAGSDKDLLDVEALASK